MRSMIRYRTTSVLTATVAATLAATGCSDEPAAPEGGGSYPVVHAVMNPLRTTQNVLVEEALVGRVTPDTTLEYDPREPVLTGGGVPVSHAQVRVIGPLRIRELTEQAFFSPPPNNAGGVEGDGSGRGVYFFINSSPNGPSPGQPPAPDVYMRVFPGDTLRLEISWPDGSHFVTGQTIVPLLKPLPSEAPITFNRDGAPLVIELPGPAAALNAARYLVRVRTPYGPMTFFTDSAQVRFSGSLLNIDLPGAPAAFVPGFSQQVEIAAVDRNFFDYYRSQAGDRSGTVQISHLSGAGGLFGSYTPLGRRTIHVTANQDAPVEGSFARVLPPTSDEPLPPPDTLDLYLSSGGRLTGQRRGGGATGVRGNLVGTLDGSQVRLALVSFASIRDTLATFTGQLQAPGIVGRFSFDARDWTYERVP